MKSVKVSIWCIAYNHEKYIRDTLDGFLSQKTDFEYEIIVHDDASADGTGEIIREYAKRCPDLIKPIIQEKNQAGSGNFQPVAAAMMAVTQGEYIAFCEGDDYWNDEKKLQRQADFLDSHREYGACVHNSRLMNMKTQEVSLINPAGSDYDLSLEEILQYGHVSYQLSSLMLRRNLAEIIFSDRRPEFFDKLPFMDLSIAVYLVLNGKVRFLSDAMSSYRKYTKGSWSTNLQKSRPEQLERHHLAMISFLQSVDSYTRGNYARQIDGVIKNHYLRILVHYCREFQLSSDQVLRYFPRLSGKGKAQFIFRVCSEPARWMVRKVRRREGR